MLDDRKTAILRAIVEEYIATALPVGSSHIAKSQEFAVSSATVRNDMAALEREGFLTQPHTSAGRIPTDKGYRFFVDNLVPNGSLGSLEQAKVGSFSSAHFRLEETLQRTSTLLTQLTNYASVVIGPSVEVAVVRSVQLVRLSSHHLTVVVVLSNGSVENEQLEISQDVSDENILNAVFKLQKLMLQAPLRDIQLMRDANQKLVDDISPLCEKVLASLDRTRNDESFLLVVRRRWLKRSMRSRSCAMFCIRSNSNMSWLPWCATC